MLAVPALSAVTTPVADTVATAELSDIHSMVRPVNAAPLAARVAAVACVVSTALIVLADNATITDATGAGMTVSIALPLCPSLVAMIFATPTPTALTVPLATTVATV